MIEDNTYEIPRSVTRGSTPEITYENKHVTGLPLIIKNMKDTHHSGQFRDGARQHVHIIDQPCGTGKTTSLLNSFEADQRYLVVVPLLSEVERVIRDARVNFYQPEDDETKKADDLERLVMEGVNIVTTHALYKDIAWVSSRGLLDDYHIIIDEVLDVVHDAKGKSPISIDEIYIKDGYATVGSDGLITPTEKWDKIYTGVADTFPLSLYRQAKSQTLYRVDGKFFLWALPASLLNSGKSITVYTYMAEGSLMVAYLKKIGISYSHQRFADEPSFRLKARRLITIKGIPALEKSNIRFSYTQQTLSKSRDAREKKVSHALKNLKQRQLSGVAMSDVLITCAKENWFKDGNDKSEKPQGFAKGSRMFDAQWIANTTRGTNDHAHCSVCIYLYDQHINPYIKRWLGLGSDPRADDRYALTELIQWVYRSRVRRGLPVTLYIPSKRMRDLFVDWLAGQEAEGDQHPHQLIAA